jgi:hypothetical protein
VAIVRTALGTNSGKPPGNPWTALSGIAVADGASILVAMGATLGGIPTATWNGISMTLDAAVSSQTATSTYIFRLDNVTGATGNVIITQPNLATSSAAMFAIQVAGLTANSFDKTAGVSNAGSTTPNSGATAATAVANEFLLGIISTNGPIADTVPTWGGDTATAGQRVGTTGGSATTNEVLAEGFSIQSVIGARTSSATGITSRAWSCLITTYQGAVVNVLPDLIQQPLFSPYRPR